MSTTDPDVQRLLRIYREATLARSKPWNTNDNCAFIDPKEKNVVMYAPVSTGGTMRISSKYDPSAHVLPTAQQQQATHQALYAALRQGHMNADMVKNVFDDGPHDVKAARTVANGSMQQFDGSLEVARIKIDDAMRTKLRNVLGFAAAAYAPRRDLTPAWLSGVLIDLSTQTMVATDGGSLCTVKIDPPTWGVLAAAGAGDRGQFLLSAEFVRLLISKTVGVVTLSLRASKDYQWAYALSDHTRITERLCRQPYPTYQRVIPRVDGRYEAWVKFVDPHCAELKRYINNCRATKRLPLLRLALSLNGQMLWAYEFTDTGYGPLIAIGNVKPVDSPCLAPRLYQGVGLDAKRLLHALQTLDGYVTIFIPVDRTEDRLPLRSQWEPWMLTTDDYTVVISPAKLD